MKDENKRCHLNNIQNVITRMGNNSFSLKGWSVGAMIAIYAFAGTDSNKAVIVTIMPLLIFWILDAYYLMLERKYRKLYEEERIKNEKNIDFSMDIKSLTIEMKNINKYSYFCSFISKTVMPFYIIFIVTTLIIYFVKF